MALRAAPPPAQAARAPSARATRRARGALRPRGAPAAARRSRARALAPVAERVLGAAAWLLPVAGAAPYGAKLLVALPFLVPLLLPVLKLMSSVPYANMILFFAVYLGVVNNTRWSYTTRFNALNAILVDLLLILPKMAASLFPPASAVAAQLWGYLFNTLFGLVLVAAVVGVYKSLVNEEVRLPFLEDAVRAQMSY